MKSLGGLINNEYPLLVLEGIFYFTYKDISFAIHSSMAIRIVKSEILKPFFASKFFRLLIHIINYFQADYRYAVP